MAALPGTKTRRTLHWCSEGGGCRGLTAHVNLAHSKDHARFWRGCEGNRVKGSFGKLGALGKAPGTTTPQPAHDDCVESGSATGKGSLVPCWKESEEEEDEDRAEGSDQDRCEGSYYVVLNVKGFRALGMGCRVVKRIFSMVRRRAVMAVRPLKARTEVQWAFSKKDSCQPQVGSSTKHFTRSSARLTGLAACTRPASSHDRCKVCHMGVYENKGALIMDPQIMGFPHTQDPKKVPPNFGNPHMLGALESRTHPQSLRRWRI